MKCLLSYWCSRHKHRYRAWPPAWIVAVALSVFASASNAATTSYAYDAFGRLKDVLIEDGGQISFSYDEVGNRTRRAATAAGRSFEADVSLTSTAPPAAIGRRASLVLTVNNLGPDAAANVRVALSLAGPFHKAQLWASQGRCTGEPVVCALGALANGDAARIEVRMIPTAANVISVNGNASTEALDADTSNNTVALSLTASSGPSGDADGDGLPDSWESRYGFDPHDAADADADPDRDGRSNGEEYAAKSNPVVAHLDADELAERAELRKRAARILPAIRFIILDDDNE